MSGKAIWGKAPIGAALAELSDPELRVLLALSSFQGESADCNPGRAAICERAGWKPTRPNLNRVSRCTGSLQEKGHLTVEVRRGRALTNTYVVGSQKAHAACALTEQENAHAECAPTPEIAHAECARVAHAECAPIGKAQGKGKGLSCEAVVTAWNEFAATVGLPCVRKLTATRRRQVTARCGEWARDGDPVAVFADILAHVKRSDFLLGNANGNGHRPFRATFDWLVKNEGNSVKVLEGNYGDKRPRKEPQYRDLSD